MESIRLFWTLRASHAPQFGFRTNLVEGFQDKSDNGSDDFLWMTPSQKNIQEVMKVFEKKRPGFVEELLLGCRQSGRVGHRSEIQLTKMTILKTNLLLFLSFCTHCKVVMDWFQICFFELIIQLFTANDWCLHCKWSLSALEGVCRDPEIWSSWWRWAKEEVEKDNGDDFNDDDSDDDNRAHVAWEGWWHPSWILHCLFVARVVAT